MKKIFFSIFMFLPLMASAQEVLTPQQQLEKAQKQLEEAKLAVEAAQAKANQTERSGEKAKNANTFKDKNGNTVKDDPKYLDSDAVTYNKEGKVEFDYETDANGKSAKEIYDIVLQYMTSLTKEETNIGSRVTMADADTHTIVNAMDEWIVFSKSFLSLDRTRCRYQLAATISDNSLKLTLNRILYLYETEHPSGFTESAENIISDKMALNKKKTALSHLFGKFRKKTIDRKDQIFNELTALVKAK